MARYTLRGSQGLAHGADRLVGGPSAFLVIDDTALPKQGTLLVGVARQYCGQLGKRANCQSLVSLILAQDEVPVPMWSSPSKLVRGEREFFGHFEP